MCCGTIINSGIDTVVVEGRFEGADRSYKEKLLEMAGSKGHICVIDGVGRSLNRRCDLVESRAAEGYAFLYCE